MGVVLGSTSLLGGHGTIIAWSPELTARGLAGGPEIGIAMATLGLVVASVIGGPIGRYLIEGSGPHLHRRGAEPGRPLRRPPPEPITRNALMRTLLVVFICIILGFVVQQAVLGLGLMLPLFVPCLLVGLVVGNLLSLVPFVRPVSHTAALSLVSEFALGVFLAVSLMALQLWALAGMAGTLLAVLAVQTALGVAVSLFLAFRLLGRDYQAAVLTAGYASFVIGATPDRHRHHDRRHQALRPLPARLHRAAAGLRRLRRHRQRLGDPGLPRPLHPLTQRIGMSETRTSSAAPGTPAAAKQLDERVAHRARQLARADDERLEDVGERRARPLRPLRAGRAAACRPPAARRGRSPPTAPGRPPAAAPG